MGPALRNAPASRDVVALSNTPLVPHTEVRLWLLLYSHLTEVGAMYEVLANLTRVVAGDRFVIDPFLDHYPHNRRGEMQFLSTPLKVRVLGDMLAGVGHDSVVETLCWFFHTSLRNTFAHADYTLHEGRFRSRASGSSATVCRRMSCRSTSLPTSSTVPSATICVRGVVASTLGAATKAHASARSKGTLPRCGLLCLPLPSHDRRMQYRV
jgi:hypothetical protein